MTLDIETKSLLDELPAGDGELTVEGMRAFGAEMARRFGSGPEMARVERHTVGDGLELRVLVPHAASRAVLVFFHGGGWVAGSLDEVETLGRTLADRAACTVVLAEYRLAPEHPFPAAVDDAWTALLWAAEYSAGLPLIVAGDSSGGNLAAVVAQRSAHAGPKVALQILIEPATDADTETASYRDPANQLIVTRELMLWFFERYAPGAQRDPRLAPLRAPSLAGAPPAVVLTAEHDVLRDEGEAYAERLRAAGVDVSHKRFAGQMHGFFGQIGVLPGSAAGLDYVVAAIERYCAV
ncbi:alpha/beta hydrolase [Solirubrobacter ginsenosidimutans]|uniref:Alpha/beta hydrolase n=1 Tax=Solirubrobacter ginsenosidimutans TaxID=490573 RepID=A0A9X3N0Z1_9ACTN|nr:alpha/beta hydrolase [Solirubrobacter ginsenosidimutans]MDA0165311.1 alpha/beta hydrolase [Solirubrobacter ginsenosidimutans]